MREQDKDRTDNEGTSQYSAQRKRWGSEIIVESLRASNYSFDIYTVFEMYPLLWRYSVVVITWDSDINFPKPRFEPW
jgi:hypothetical protein